MSLMFIISKTDRRLNILGTKLSQTDLKPRFMLSHFAQTILPYIGFMNSHNCEFKQSHTKYVFSIQNKSC